jgi:hypothetical protein
MGSVETAIFVQGWPPNSHPFAYRTFSTVQRCHRYGEDDVDKALLDMDFDYRLSHGGFKDEVDSETEDNKVLES